MNQFAPPMKWVMVGVLGLVAGCGASHADHHQTPPLVVDLGNDTNPPTVARDAHGVLGEVQRLDPAIDVLLPPDAKLEILVDGVDWCEGPVWMDGGLLFSDVKQNTIYRWTPKGGVKPWLKPSGYLIAKPRGNEPGSNGLTLDAEGRLVMCQHGERRVARLERDGRTQTPLATTFDGKRFNSPNDLCFDRNGNLYFTDPPYGLPKGPGDPTAEMGFNGVFLRRPDGRVERLAIDLTFPNGVALSPDEHTLYVAVSDPKNPVVMKYAVKDDGTAGEGRVFFDASPLVAQKLKGMPDGMKVDERGNLWLGGPGGLLVISPEGKHLGGVLTGVPTANCAWGEDGSTLFVCANHNLCRIRTGTRGKVPGR